MPGSNANTITRPVLIGLCHEAWITCTLSISTIEPGSANYTQSVKTKVDDQEIILKQLISLIKNERNKREFNDSEYTELMSKIYPYLDESRKQLLHPYVAIDKEQIVSNPESISKISHFYPSFRDSSTNLAELGFIPINKGEEGILAALKSEIDPPHDDDNEEAMDIETEEPKASGESGESGEITRLSTPALAGYIWRPGSTSPSLGMLNSSLKFTF